jgi:FAD/FMN-containing dehydrogenase
MNGRKWHDSFVPTDAPTSFEGVSAVTLQPGEEWLDVYHAADEQGVIIAGGSARTVGAVGGYLLAGGHSPWSYYYGLAADNLLEATIVTPCGEHIVLNAYTNPEYFWAIRGGGGSAWGVLTSATYQTFPQPSHIQVAIFQANMSSADAYRKVYTQALKSIPAMTDAGYTGYGATNPAVTVQFIFLRPNGTNATLEQGFAGFNEILAMNGTDGISVIAGNFTLPTWRDYTEYFVSDPNIATNIQDASRLLTSKVMLHRAEDIVDLALRYPEMAAGHNFSKFQ